LGSGAIKVDEESLKHGVLSLVLAMVEIVADALKIEASKRVESGDLTEEEVERLGRALMELDKAIESIKREQGIEESVKKVREGLDDIVDEVLDRILNPERWVKEA
jgi:hypothetical protein